MRILLLSQFFDPEPTLKGITFARKLVDLGHEVEVLTGFPNYPGGKIYPGYRLGIYRKEMMQGILVHRVALYPSHDRSALRRVFNYVSFAASAAILGPFVVRRPDVLWVHHPPLTVAWPARWFKFLFGAPFVYDIHDLWPDTLGATGMMSRPGLLERVGLAAKKVYAEAGHILVISPGFKRKLEERGVPRDKVDVVYTWCEESKIIPAHSEPELARELGFAGRFCVMFAGTMGLAQGLDAVLDAAALVAKEESDVCFVLVGSGIDSERLRQRATDLQLSNVVFVPRQPMQLMGRILSLADALLVHLKDDPLFSITVPGKTQTYLRMGIPLIMAVRGDSAELVSKAAAGFVCEPENPESLVRTVLALRSLTPAERIQMGRNGAEFYERELSMNLGIAKIEGILHRVASEKTDTAYARWGKRVLDLILVIPALVLLSPLMLVAAFLVRLKLGKPVIFRQERPGLRQRVFELIKFRSMTSAEDSEGNLLSDTERLTSFGRRLRSSSLDELPELWNVLKGDMSLVGPRPLLAHYSPYFTSAEQVRFSVRPGITGLAQVSGRNDLSWDRRIEFDVQYVRTLSLGQDLSIIARTLVAVFKRSGIQTDPASKLLDFDVERRLRLGLEERHA